MKNKHNKKNKILITGATGFIGYNVSEYFHKKGLDVYGLADNSNVPKGVKPVKVNFLNFKRLQGEIKRINPDIVVHLGAYVFLDRSYEVAEKCIDVNIKGTLNLIEALKEVQLKKCIFFSTEEVYGENKVPYREDYVTYPPSPYSISKIAGENLCLLYNKLYDFPVSIFRIATAYGYHQPISRFIPSTIIRALKNEDIIFNSGKNKRDYVFVEDLIDAIEKGIGSKKSSGEIFNIGHLNSTSGKKLVKTIVKLADSRSKIIFNGIPDREGEFPNWAMDNNKARKILKWEPKTSLEVGLEKTIKFYRNKYIKI